jgi:hypothetical protein
MSPLRELKDAILQEIAEERRHVARNRIDPEVSRKAAEAACYLDGNGPPRRDVRSNGDAEPKTTNGAPP